MSSKLRSLALLALPAAFVLTSSAFSSTNGIKTSQRLSTAELQELDIEEYNPPKKCGCFTGTCCPKKKRHKHPQHKGHMKHEMATQYPEATQIPSNTVEERRLSITYDSIRSLSEVQDPRSPRFVPDRVFFELDKSKIFDTVYHRYIDRQARHIKHSKKRVLLVGYCDERGSEEYNIALGARRAQHVKEHLISRGVSASMIEVKSVGNKESLVSRSRYSENRAVKIEYIN